MLTSRIPKKNLSVLTKVTCLSESNLLFLHTGNKTLATVSVQAMRAHLKTCRICRERANKVAVDFEGALAKIHARLPLASKGRP